MRTLASAVTTASVTLLGADVAHAAGPDYFGIPAQWWILLIVILLILNLLCCLRKK
jgi:hypothetical protein